ncbi:hypothetical protein GYB22_10490 [bacterium]|nr:hypothetical protein [bacterium]
MSKLNSKVFYFLSGILIPVTSHASEMADRRNSQSLWWAAISSFFIVNLVFFFLYVFKRTPLLRVLTVASGFIVLAFQSYFVESLEVVINHFDSDFSFQGWELIVLADLQILIALLIKPKTKYRG